jgi:hypothetical protein
MSEHISWRGWARRRFLITLAVFGLLVGVPLAIVAAWLGMRFAVEMAGAANPREAFCRLPASDSVRLRLEEIDLRRRVIGMESTLAQKQAQCPLCADPGFADIALVMDTSASMRWPAGMDAAAEAQKMEQIAREAGALDTEPGQARFLAELGATPAGQERMEAARKAALAVLDGLPARARVHLMSFADFDDQHVQQTTCGVVERGVFPNADRARLRQSLQALKPNASGTPLAQSIGKGAAAVTGRPPGTPGFVVVITDGVETCGADPCAAAQAAHAADPGLSIAVIDIAHNPQLACLASATAGRIFAPGDAAGLGQYLADALRVPAQRACVPRTRAPA